MSWSIDIGAFLIALVALYFTWRTHTRQSALEADQAKLNKLLIEKEEREAATLNAAQLEVRIVSPGLGQYFFVISNLGAGPARNIRLNPTRFGTSFPSQELESFPRTGLDPGGQIELVFINTLASTTESIHVIISWEDAIGEHSQPFYPSIPKRQDSNGPFGPYQLGRETLKR